MPEYIGSGYDSEYVSDLIQENRSQRKLVFQHILRCVREIRKIPRIHKNNFHNIPQI